MNKLVEWVKFEEGFRATPYQDTVGVLTVGYGHNLQVYPLSGRDFRVKPYTKEEGEKFLSERLSEAYRAILKQRPVVKEIDDVRAAALVNMAYQLGSAGLLKFRSMWAAIESRDWALAARSAESSKWAKQTPNRARRVIHALRTGEWPQEVFK